VRNQAIWELSLAQVRVDPGVTFIEATRITDERTSDAVCGYAQLFNHASQHAANGSDPLPQGAGSGLDADLLGGQTYRQFLQLGNPSFDARDWQVRIGTQVQRTDANGYTRLFFSPPFPTAKHSAVVTHGN